MITTLAWLLGLGLAASILIVGLVLLVRLGMHQFRRKQESQVQAFVKGHGQNFRSPFSGRRALVLFNPIAGSRGGSWTVESVVCPMLKTAGIEPVVAPTQYAGHTRELLRSHLAHQGRPETRIDLIVVVGGDGTLHEVVNAVFSSQEEGGDRRLPVLPMAVVGGGSSNGFTFSLGSYDAFLATKYLLEGRQNPIDVLEVNFLDPDALLQRDVAEAKDDSEVALVSGDASQGKEGLRRRGAHKSPMPGEASSEVPQEDAIDAADGCVTPAGEYKPTRWALSSWVRGRTTLGRRLLSAAKPPKVYEVHVASWCFIAEYDTLIEGPLRWLGPKIKDAVAAPAVLARLPLHKASVWFRPKAVPKGLDYRETDSLEDVRGPNLEPGWKKLPDRKYLMLSIANVRRAAADCSLSEHLQPDDQSMDICIIDGDCPRIEVLKLFMSMDQGNHMSHPWVEIYKASEVVLIPHHVDGGVRSPAMDLAGIPYPNDAVHIRLSEHRLPLVYNYTPANRQ